jgi:hypothetical protein
MIRDHIANLGIEIDDFDYAPFAQEGGVAQKTLPSCFRPPSKTLVST